MRFKLSFLFLFYCILLTGQKNNHVDSISYDELQELTNSKEYKNYFDVNEYITRAGDKIVIGDTLVIGKPSNSNNITQGSVAIGQAINNHSYIYLGTTAAALTGTLMMGNDGMLNDRVFVVGISAGRISKKNDYEIYLELNKVGGGRFLGVKKLARVLFEKAMESGEIINSNAKMTRSEAIRKLKEAKELYDLEMMSSDEYDALKNQLSPIIKEQ
ncbi:hypothetical protein SAMN04488007_3668 [Maribacter aquivivus]|uniref:Uncharacterized protein n=1 Tax=Maribacter aquivivus TaxID=228958 RepID=A0A1M6UST8_9FLAO|nr:hypothetical protein [Maribacter aquivivus]SHK72270.1 hypothetical protein SAMN04488007_3668 [Maribacter aquivivus]